MLCAYYNHIRFNTTQHREWNFRLRNRNKYVNIDVCINKFTRYIYLIFLIKTYNRCIYKNIRIIKHFRHRKLQKKFIVYKIFLFFFGRSTDFKIFFINNCRHLPYISKIFEKYKREITTFLYKTK